MARFRYLTGVRDWLRWFVKGQNRFASLCATVADLDQSHHDSRLKLESRVETLYVQAAKGISQIASDLYDQGQTTQAAITDLEKQLAQLRAIVTQHKKDEPQPIPQARHMNQVRNFLKQGDEDAA